MLMRESKQVEIKYAEWWITEVKEFVGMLQLSCPPLIIKLQTF